MIVGGQTSARALTTGRLSLTIMCRLTRALALAELAKGGGVGRIRRVAVVKGTKKG